MTHKLFITGVAPDAVLRRAAADYELSVWREPQPIGGRLAGLARGQDALIVMPGDRLDAAALQTLPASVQVLATYSVGHDHVDLAAATARGLPVYHTPDVLTDAVADLALLLVLAAARGASDAERCLREGRWGPWAPTAFLGRGLQGRRLGLFGMGRIGQAIARRAAAFGMVLHYHKRSALAPSEAAGATYHDSLDGLLAVSDVLCVAVPSTPALRGVLDARRLALLPRGALLVNIARGDLIDEQALFDAVQRGHVAGLGMDVYQGEPDIDPRWKTLPRCTLLPHIGSATEEARTAMGLLALEGVAAHFSGRPGANCLNPQVYAPR